MLQGNKDLIGRLFPADGGLEPLVVVPSPEESALRKRGGASLDLRLGRWFRSMRQANSPVFRIDHDAPTNDVLISNLLRETQLQSDFQQSELTKEVFIRFGGTFYLHPGQFVLGITLEWIRFPNDLSGYVTGKSSWGRRGLVIETAAGIHPGFTGCLTLELANVGEIPIALEPGMEVCQLFFHRIDSPTERAESQFIGRRKPGLGKIDVDDTFRALKG